MYAYLDLTVIHFSYALCNDLSPSFSCIAASFDLFLLIYFQY